MARGTPPWRPRPPEMDVPSGQGEYGQHASTNTPWEPGEERETSGMTQSRGLDKDGGGSGDGMNKPPFLEQDSYVEDSPPDTKIEKEYPDWIKRAKDAYQFSTTYIDSNYRKQWEDSIRVFNNQHPSDSKYNTELYRKRSNLFRPKTRAMIRKNEAAAASAYFSNLELISVDPLNEGIKEERISAEVMQQIIKYRLTKSIPWFLLMMGAIQDSQVQGASIAHVYWKFSERYDEKGKVVSKEDMPVVDLVPIENIRIDPGAHWLDPINTSPYLIHLIPMYWCDVQDRMKYPDPKGRRWKEHSATAAFAFSSGQDDSTRAARLGVGREDPAQQKRTISDYDIVWVHRHIHKWDGEDWEFYTLSSERLLTDPEPLRTTVWHGRRPYVMGRAIVETHKVIPASMPMLLKGLQEEANEVQNQRIDNVKFALNKGFLVKRGKNVDLGSLVRNVPGRITMVDDTENDVKEMSWQDVTQSAYLEQDRIDGDFNDVAGNFSPLQVQTQRTPRESSNTMKQLQAPASLMTEYMLKTHTETFAQPVLRQIMWLEQHYETDSTILALAGEKAKIIQRYGVSEITDEMLDKELTLNVHVGMGATDPVGKLQRFVYAVTSFASICKLPPPGIDLKAVAKEMFGLSGYQDGQRFMIDGVDPEVAKLMQQNKQLMMALQQAKIQIKNREGANQAKIITSQDTNKTKVQTNRESIMGKLEVERMKHGNASKHKLADHIMSLELQANEHAHDNDQMQGSQEHEADQLQDEQAHEKQIVKMTPKPKPTKK